MSQPPEWCADFVGIPYADGGRDLVTNGNDVQAAGALDCWGLLRLIMLRKFGRTIQDHAAESWADRSQGRELAQYMGAQLRSNGLWTPVWVKPEVNAVLDPRADVRPGDCLLIRMDGVPVHVGVVAETPWFLHTERAQGSCIDDMHGPRWHRRILGVYRFNDDPNNSAA